MAYKMRNPYPKMGTVATSRKGKINPKSDSNLEDGREKSSAFQKSSPLHDEKYVARQLAKAKRLKLLAEKREKRTKEKKEAFSKAGRKWEGVEPIFFTGKWARKRSEKAFEKAAAGSRKAYRKSKRQ